MTFVFAYAIIQSMRQNPYEYRDTTGTEEQSANNNKKRNKTINIIIYIVAGVLFLTAGIILFREFVLINPQEYVDENSDVSVLTSMEPLGTPVSNYDIIPVMLTFQEAGVSCKIAPVGVDSSNVMESVEDAHIASWLSVDPYVAPGDTGNAIIGGHNLWKGQAGTFSVLKNVQLGDSVLVGFNNGEWRYFDVIEIGQCDFDDTTYMDAEADEALLTLITCKGDWNSELGTSQSRVVVVCKLHEN